MRTKSPRPPALDIIIIGAGLGGLSAAISISLSSSPSSSPNPLHNITILEQSSFLTEVGAGIQVPPNSSKILIKWGLKEVLERDSVRPRAFILRRYRDGKVLGGYYGLVAEGEGHEGVEGEFGGPYW